MFTIKYVHARLGSRRELERVVNSLLRCNFEPGDIVAPGCVAPDESGALQMESMTLLTAISVMENIGPVTDIGPVIEAIPADLLVVDAAEGVPIAVRCASDQKANCAQALLKCGHVDAVEVSAVEVSAVGSR